MASDDWSDLTPEQQEAWRSRAVTWSFQYPSSWAQTQAQMQEPRCPYSKKEEKDLGDKLELHYELDESRREVLESGEKAPRFVVYRILKAWTDPDFASKAGEEEAERVQKEKDLVPRCEKCKKPI